MVVHWTVHQVWAAAKKLFDDADLDKNGHLDVEEVNLLVQTLQKTLPGSAKLSAETRMDMVSHVESAIARFDTDGDGRLNFDEFTHMLTIKPWSDMLPEGARDKLHFKRIKEGRARAVSAGSKNDATGFLRAAHELFSQTDIDDNGVLSRGELSFVLRKVAIQEGRKSQGLFDELDSVSSALLDDAIAKNGTEKGVDFEGFIGILSSNPWRSLLPKGAADELVMHGAKYRSESPATRAAKRAPKVEVPMESFAEEGELARPYKFSPMRGLYERRPAAAGPQWSDEGQVAVPVHAALRPKLPTSPSAAAEGSLQFEVMGYKGFTREPSQAYLIVECGGEMLRTRSLGGEQSMKVTQGTESVVIKMFEKSAMGDDYLGHVQISLSAITTGKHQDLWVPLEDCDDPAKLNVQCIHRPVVQTAIEALDESPHLKISTASPLRIGFFKDAH